MKSEDCTIAGFDWIPRYGGTTIPWGERAKLVKPALDSLHRYKADSKYGFVFVSNEAGNDGIREVDAEEFAALAKQWKRDTRRFSSVGDIVMHEAYQRVMAGGANTLPLILADLKESPSHWFYALRFIVGRDVAAGATSFAAARAAWLEWGYRNNFI